MAPREAGGAHARIGDETLAIGWCDAMEQLHRRGWQTGLPQRLDGLVGCEVRHARAARMRLRDHWVARRDRRGEVAAGHRAVGERKISRWEDNDRPEPECRRANVAGGIDHRHAPRALAGGGRGLPDLIEHARQFDLGQPRLHGEPRLGMGGRDEFIGLHLEPRRVALEKIGPPFVGQRCEFTGGSHGGVERGSDVAPAAHGPGRVVRPAGRRVERAKRIDLCRGAPAAGAQDEGSGYHGVRSLRGRA